MSKKKNADLPSVKLNRNNIPAQQLHHLEILRNVTVLLCVYHTPSVQSKHFIHFSPEKKAVSFVAIAQIYRRYDFRLVFYYNIYLTLLHYV